MSAKCSRPHAGWISLHFGGVGCLLLHALLGWRIIVQHVSQYVLGILQSLSHFCIVAVQGLTERHDGTISLLVHIGHQSIIRIQQDLCMVLEVYLYDFVAQTEHDGVAGPHPLLHVHRAWSRSVLWITKLVLLSMLV